MTKADTMPQRAGMTAAPLLRRAQGWLTRSSVNVAAWLLAASSSACSAKAAGEGMPNPPASSAITSTTSSAETASDPARPERPVAWVAIAPRRFIDELEPLVALREKAGIGAETLAIEDALANIENGRPKEGALRDAIADYRKKHPSLKFVVLVGVPTETPESVPAFMIKRRYDFPGGGEMFPSDHGYEIAGGEPMLAVGRLPARSESDVSAMVRKIVAYESAPTGGEWQRRVNVIGGPGNFGALADGMIEAQATALIDGLLSYDLDVSVMFAKESSPFMYRPDRMGQKIVEDMSSGSLFTVYAGHGLETALDSIRYRQKRYWIGTATDFSRVNVQAGNPLFISLTCLTGAYALTDGKRSLAEDLILNEKGPIATFASSSESHPYPNILYAESLLETFFQTRVETIGQGIAKAKMSMLDKSMALARLFVDGNHDDLKADHLDLYNLFGDPATKLRYAGSAKVSPRTAKVAPGAEVTVDIAAEGSRYLLTLETERAAIKPGIVSAYDLDAMGIEEAFAAMVKNHGIANDKVLGKVDGTLESGKAAPSLKAPMTPGKYYLKLIAWRDGADPVIAHSIIEVTQ